MLRRAIGLLFCLLLAGAAFGAPLEGFWQKDAKWERRASLQRKIYVSARTDTHEGLSRLQVQAMGLVAAPVNYAAKKSKQYGELPKVSGHFKAADYRPETQQLFLVTEALRWQARMLLKLTYDQDEGARERHRFEVIGGSFQGLQGEFIFTEFAAEKTQLAVNASYSGKTLPLPRILMGVALEVIVEQVAQKIRTHLERSYQESQKPPPSVPSTES